MDANLINYIKQQLAQGTSKETIRQNLISNNWNPSSINDVFLSLEANSALVASSSAPSIPVKYAGFWIRWVAMIVDSLIVGILVFVPFVFFVSAGSVSELNLILNFRTTNFGLKILSYLFQASPVWLYFILMTYYKGATLGKMVVGVEVKSTDLQKLSFGRVLFRETIGKILSYVVLLIGYIMAGFTKKKQALHDKLVGSIVVYKDPLKPRSKWATITIIIAAILPIIAIIGILSSVVLASLNFARQKSVDARVKSSVDARVKSSVDARVKSSVGSIMVNAILYFDENSTFTGFVWSDYTVPSCSESVFANVSADGNKIAVFGKSCTNHNVFFCKSEDVFKKSPLYLIKEVPADIVTKNKFDCKEI